MVLASIQVDGKAYEAVHVATGKSNVLLIRAGAGFLGCGYFRVDTADRLGDAVAIVRGVQTPDDMLGARVEEISQAAGRAGVRIGMSGREALPLLAATALPAS